MKRDVGYRKAPGRLVAFLGPILAGLLILGLTACSQAQAEQLPAIKDWQPPKVTTESIPLAATEPDADGIQLAGVGTAEDGAMIIVNFKGPAKLIQSWNQGDVFVVDESSGDAYNQIPVAPVIGPLFGKPRTDGQPAYVMLVNPYNGVKVGSIVTVVLGKYKRLHVEVK